MAERPHNAFTMAPTVGPQFRTTWTVLRVLILLACVVSSEARSAPYKRSFFPVLVVSFDGFRPEYFNRSLTPNFDRIRQNGTQAEYLRNVFPTKTFTNHFTIATGLFAGAHGVTGNSVYDRALGKKLDYGYELFHQNKNVKPIWTLHEELGGHSGCMMWPGSEFSYAENISCTYTTKYKHSLSWWKKVDTVIDWMIDKEMPATLVMLYFDEPDYMGHVFSPNSDKVSEMIVRTDSIVKYIHERLAHHKILNETNILYVSDHGMDTVRSPNFINLTDFMTPDTFDMYGNTPVMQIVPRAGFEVQVLAEISAGAQRNGKFKVYTASTLPDRWKVANTDRMGPITAVADIKYAFQDMWRQIETYKEKFNISLTPEHEYGMHGYDNAEESMHAIFIAVGPVFLANTTTPPFDSVQLYLLFMALLDIAPPHFKATNELVEKIQNILGNPFTFQYRIMFACTLALLICLLLCVATIIFCFTGLYFFKCRLKPKCRHHEFAMFRAPHFMFDNRPTCATSETHAIVEIRSVRR